MRGSAYKRDTSRLLSPHDWRRAKDVITVAADLDGNARTRLVEARFPNEPLLRTEVLSLLAVHDRIKFSLGTERIAFISGSQTPGPAAVPAAHAGEVIRVGLQYGPYRVVRLLGAGGMGQVYLADDVRLGRSVALKTLAGSWLNAPTARQRLLREARTAAALSHPYIATLYDILEDEKYLLMVMEYVEGRTAAALVDEGQMPLGQALRIASQVAEALIYAHDRGFIHCDLKPSNVQVSLEGTAKVLDFGLARAKYDQYEIDERSATPRALIIGTPPYMPPERLQRGLLNVSGDIYSLGVTLFEMLTGHLPFEERESAALVGAIIGTEAPAVSSLVPAAPSSLDQLVSRALAKDPKDRYQTAREFSRDLNEILEVLDNKRSDTSAAVPARAYSRTLPALAVIFALIGGLSFIGLITSTVYGSPLGVTFSFEGESPLWWPVWGVRSLILPLSQIIFALLIFGVVSQLWRTSLGASPFLRHWRDRLYNRNSNVVAWMGRLSIRTLAGSLLTVHVAALVLFSWRFWDIFQALDNFRQNSGSLSALSPANSTEHKLYMRAFSLLILVLGWAWYRLFKKYSRTSEAVSTITFMAGVSAMILSCLLMTAPYRLFFHNKAERVRYAGRPCYLIARKVSDGMLFCPTQDASWSHLINLNDPALQHSGVRENIFSATEVHGPKSQ